MHTMFLQAAGPATAEVTHIPAYKPGTGAQGGLARVKTLQAFFKVNTESEAPLLTVYTY